VRAYWVGGQREQAESAPVLATFFTEKLNGLWNQPPLGLPLEKAPALCCDLQRSVLALVDGLARRLLEADRRPSKQAGHELAPLNSMRPACCSFTNPSVRTYLFLQQSRNGLPAAARGVRAGDEAPLPPYDYLSHCARHDMLTVT